MHGVWRAKVVGVLLVAAWLLNGSAAYSAEPKDGTFTASDGVKIHYLEAGQGSPVVLIHGYSGTARGNWFLNGVADALAKHHCVMAIDCRGHGHSEKPHDPDRYGPQMAADVIEMMDHLGIQQAHVHGYSMGGFLVTGQLLATHPERFITASYGGSGVPEVEEQSASKCRPTSPAPIRKKPRPPKPCAAIPIGTKKRWPRCAAYPWKPGERGEIDLTNITIPVLAINGEFDGPNAKTHRMQRELKDFTAVVLPGKSHLTAIMAGYMPQLYIDSLAAFIDAHDKS